MVVSLWRVGVARPAGAGPCAHVCAARNLRVVIYTVRYGFLVEECDTHTVRNL